MRGRAVPMMLAALSTYHAGMPQIVIVGEPAAPDTSGADAGRSPPVYCRPRSSCRLASRIGVNWRGCCRGPQRSSSATAAPRPTSAATSPARCRRLHPRNSRRSSPHGILGRYLAARRQPRHHRRRRVGPAGPRAWTDADVAFVLEGMLRALDRAKHPEADARPAGRASRFQLDRQPVREPAAS